jgi:hypothetical protein
LPKEAKGGGARTVAKLAIFGGCMMSFGGGYFLWSPDSSTREHRDKEVTTVEHTA